MQVIDENFVEHVLSTDGNETHSLTGDALVRWYKFTNGIPSFGELALGLLGGNVAITVDGLHGTAEIVIANAQITAAHETDHIDDVKRQRTYATLSGLALMGGGLAGLEMAGSINFGEVKPALDYLGMGAAGLSAVSAIGAAACLVHRARQKYGSFWDAPMTETEHDVTRHIVKLDAPSATMAAVSGLARIASLLSRSKGFPIDPEVLEHGVGVASGVWGAYLFRPTKNNLEHHHSAQNAETLPPAIEELERLPLGKRIGQALRRNNKH